MRLAIVITIFSGLMIISGCSSDTKSSLLANNAQTETTGYWYLGDNGQRQWRTFTTDESNKKTKYDQNFSNGISPFGNASGR